MDIYNEIRFEEDVHNLCTEESIYEFIYELVEDVRVKVTSSPRLISLLEN